MVPSKWCVALLVCLLPMANPSRAGERILVPPPDRDEPMTIQQAIDIARDGDTVLVADGVYYENIRLNGKKIVVASYDLFREGDKHATRTIIRGNDRALVPQPAVFFTGGENSETLVLGFTIEGGTGTAFEYGGAGFMGGGIAVVNAGGRIERNIIRGNGVAGDVAAGGGIGVFNTIGGYRIVIEGNIIEGNAAAGVEMGIGGGVFVVGAEAVLRANRIAENTANGQWVWGGGADLEDPDSYLFPITVQENEIVSNTATAVRGAWGGGLVVWNGTVLVKQNVLRRNIAHATAVVAVGGGMHLESWKNTAAYRVEGNMLEENVATSFKRGEVRRRDEDRASGMTEAPGASLAYAGGMHAVNLDLMLIQNTFLANRVLSVKPASGAAAQLTRVARTSGLRQNRFEGNTAEGGDCTGALHVQEAVSLRLCENIFTRNIVADGGGISLVRSGFRLENAIFVENAAKSGGAVYVEGSPVGEQGLADASARAAGFVPGRPSGLRPDARPVPGVRRPGGQVIVNTTMYMNAGTEGGSVCVRDARPLIFNSILWSKPEGSGPWEIDADKSTELAVAYCDIRTGYPEEGGEGNFTAVPRLHSVGGDLAMLRDNSPCIGAGVGILDAWGQTFDAPVCDCHGHCRPQPQGSAPDVGAEESRLARPIGPVIKDVTESALLQNYPNPFNPLTVIHYQIAEPGRVTVKVYDLLGREVATLVDEMREPGSYEVRWDASSVASGMYLYKMTAGAFTETRRLVVVR